MSMRKILIVLFLAAVGCVTTPSNPVDKSKMAEGYYQKGLAYLQEKNYELASVEFNRSVQTDNEYKFSYYSLGYIADQQGKFKEATGYYEKAIDLDPKFSEAYNSLGVIYAKQQKWDMALKNYNKALENKLYSTPHVPYLNIGDVYMATKNYAKAADAYREAKRFVLEDFIIYALGNALLEGGKVKESIVEFKEGVSMAPQNPGMRYGLALALFKSGDKKAAAAEFRKVTELSPKSELAQKAQEYLKILR
jgi:type IV pilus assembly protein PilF